MQKERQSNFELLRIISCFMIIVLHYLNGDMGGALDNVIKGSLNYYIAYFIESLCIVGVNSFVLICGYFMIKKTEIYIGKIVKLFLTLLFYSLICLFIAIAFNIKDFTYKEFVLAIIPFLGGRRWFISTYIILFLLSPYINKLLNNISKKNYLIYLIILILIFSLWPTFLPYPPVNDGGYGIINFILLYSIGGYFKLHTKKIPSKLTTIIMYIFFSILTTIMSFYNVGAWNYNNIFNIMSSLSLFLLFNNIKIKSKYINNLSKLSFGIYILHSDPSLRNVFYSWMRCSNYYDSIYFIVHLIICCLLSYIIFGIIDYIKEKIFEMTIYKAVDNNKYLNYKIKV